MVVADVAALKVDPKSQFVLVRGFGPQLVATPKHYSAFLPLQHLSHAKVTFK